MSLTKDLWNNNYNLAMISLNSNFVQGIKKGNLPKNIFQEYVAQDYFFLESFARAYGLAISKSSNKESIYALSKLLIGVSEELNLHEKYAKDWEIDLNQNSIKEATKNYTDFLEEVSTKKSCIEILTAMSPCMRLYSWIGKTIANEEKNNPYINWILTYSDKSFENLAKSLEILIDDNANLYEFDQLNFFYERAMQLEADFFEANSKF